MKMRILLSVIMLSSFCLSYGQSETNNVPDSLYFIQVSASRTYVNPDVIKEELTLTDSIGVIKSGDWYKYFVGPFPTHQDAYSHMTENKIDGYVTQYFEGEVIIRVPSEEESTEPAKQELVDIQSEDSVMQETIDRVEEVVDLIQLEESLVAQADSVSVQDTLMIDESDSLREQELSLVEDSTITEVKMSGNTGVFIDNRDNKNYSWVKIGDQVWMAENLRFQTPYSIIANSDSLQEGSYGYLYDFRDAKMICPNGWHLPTDKDWMCLESQIGLENTELRSIGHRSTGYLGILLKSKSGWIEEGNGMDSFSLNILPAGIASKKGETKRQSQSSHLWSSSKTMFGIWVRYFRHDSPGILRGLSSPQTFLSIRCIKDTDAQ